MFISCSNNKLLTTMAWRVCSVCLYIMPPVFPSVFYRQIFWFNYQNYLCALFSVVCLPYCLFCSFTVHSASWQLMYKTFLCSVGSQMLMKLLMNYYFMSSVKNIFRIFLIRGSVIGSECVSGLKQLAQELHKSGFG